MRFRISSTHALYLYNRRLLTLQEEPVKKVAPSLHTTETDTTFALVLNVPKCSLEILTAKTTF